MERVTEAAVRRQRTIQTTLLFIILATLPCYCVGFVLLGVAPRGGQRTPVITATTAGIASATPLLASLVPSITPFPTLGDASFSPLRATPTQIRLFPTFTLTFTPAVTPIIPTKTPIPLPPSQTPIVILTPTSTTIVIPTFTPVPPTRTLTQTPQPSLTPTPVTPTATHTQAPTATETFTPTTQPTAQPTTAVPVITQPTTGIATQAPTP